MTRNGEWHSIGYKDERFADASGRVLGSVRGGYREYIAVANGSVIGAYMSEEQAKAAVERALLLEIPNA